MLKLDQNYFGLTDKDFVMAKELKSRELINPLSKTNLFRNAIYSILSPRENYPNLIKNCYILFMNDQLTSPELVLAKHHQSQAFSRMPLSKQNDVLKFSNWFATNQDELFSRISELNQESSYDLEFGLREHLVKDAYGLGLKCASLFLNSAGLEQLVPVDRWLMRILAEKGNLDAQDYFLPENKIRGVSKQLYLDFENYFRVIAKEYDITPAFLQKTLWCKYSRWNDQNNFGFTLFPQLALNKFYES